MSLSARRLLADRISTYLRSREDERRCTCGHGENRHETDSWDMRTGTRLGCKDCKSCLRYQWIGLTDDRAVIDLLLQAMRMLRTD